MFKVERYRYFGENNEEFTYDNIYTVRKSRDGYYTFISSNKGEKMLKDLKLAQTSYHNDPLLESFERIGEELFKSYKEYTELLKQNAGEEKK